MADEMHGDGTEYSSLHDVANGPKCVDCHEDAGTATSSKKVHSLHHETVSCTVCHSVQYKHCYGCHVGKDDKGLPYFQTEKTIMDFKIGLNPTITKERPYKFVTVRHVPTNPGLFDYYVKDGLKNFDQVPTWKSTTPHNIQLNTPQNKSCKSCHKKKKLFLTDKDVGEEEREANRSVIVPESEIPTKTKKK
jgi:thiosulfate/3-mercaptopyruvate sulfurtransferase